MTILDSLNARISVKKQEAIRLSPLERVAKAIQDDAIVSSSVLVQKDWDSWNAKHGKGAGKTVAPYAVGTKVSVNGQQGEIGHVVPSSDPDYPHKYRIGDGKGGRLFNNQYQNHNNVEPI